MTPEIIHSTDFVRDAVALIEREADIAIFERGEFHLALSGGNTPKPVYQALAARRDAWKEWIVTFGDERCVPPDSDQSNYRMAKESFFDHAPIPAENILRVRGEADPAVAALEYEEELRKRTRGHGIYRHDLLLLGMGDDGHTASLFPGTDALGVTDRWVVSNFVPKFNTHRITFTYPLLNAARHVCFLVNSKGKDGILEEVFSGKSSYPCAAVRPVEGNLTWLLGA
ncbi:MAG: 6-phosphogluconolactonase [Terrimicrobiaceae bacterium]